MIMSLFLMAGTIVGCGSESGSYLPSSGKSLDHTTLSRLVGNSAQSYNVSQKLISAVIANESSGDPAAVSRAGAQGIMQLMPATSLAYGVTNPFDAAQNIDGGTHYIHDLLKRFHGNTKLAVAAYNAGPGAVEHAHGVPAFSETRTYVARVMTSLSTQ